MITNELAREEIIALTKENKHLRAKLIHLQTKIMDIDADKTRLEQFFNFMIIELQDFSGVDIIDDEINKTFKDLKYYGKRHIH